MQIFPLDVLEVLKAVADRVRQRAVVVVVRHQRDKPRREDDAPGAHFHGRAGLAALHLAERLTAEPDDRVVAGARQAHADGRHVIQRPAQLVAAGAERRFEVFGQRVAQPRAEEPRRGVGREGQIDQCERGRRIVKEKAVKRPVLAVDDGERGDRRAVGNQRGQADQRNPQLMRDALRGINGLAAAHADQKIRLHRRDFGAEPVHGGLRTRAAEGEGAEHLHGAGFKPRLERGKPLFHRGAAADEGETRAEIPAKLGETLVYAAAETEARQGDDVREIHITPASAVLPGAPAPRSGFPRCGRSAGGSGG